MQLKKIFISGFKSISNQNPQTIDLEHELTTFIGHNGTGKSTAMEALNKLFSVDNSLRSLSINDFHNADDGKDEKTRSLIIETWFSFPKPKEGKISIPPLIEHLTIDKSDGNILFRVRLEGKLSFEANPMGDIDEDIWVVSTSDEVVEESSKQKLSAAVRNAIQVSYVPANRDPLLQLKYSSKAVLGRLLKAIEWVGGSQEVLEEQAAKLNALTKSNPALNEIAAAINASWGNIYKGRYLSQASLNFPLANIDEILKLIQLQFNPDETGNTINVDRLSDGQKSLVYFSLIKAMFDIDKKTRELISSGTASNFNPEKMRLPIFSMISLEEPENHLSPHYLGRIIKLVKDYGRNELCQVIISSHSSSILSRIEPEQIRHFRLDQISKSTVVSALTLPEKEDELSKFIKEAVKSYPEIYFSKLVIFGEGDSEEIIIPKVLELYSTEIDSHSISVVPLGGRHVNHFWRLLKSLQIPFITLLDFDIDRNGGGFGRLRYAIEQLSIFCGGKYGKTKEKIPAWDDERDPTTFKIPRTDGDSYNVVAALENHNIYFSSPLDIDYAMIEAFPDIFCEKDVVYGERGPKNIEQEEQEEQEEQKKELINAVLKKGNSGVRYEFSVDYLKYFLWYRYRFLSNKSKPASHVRMFSKIEEKYTPDEIREKLPPVLIRVADKTVSLLAEVIE
ncbi:ATP-dependent nuclease [Klebsiella quasipneumoniae]|uniref:ATP-dependent nuclease n=1 Tax=Klebsiella quasipneumoniae TaxID=1463165 RepID=UPI001F57AF9D|nr:AAA family ATPase [Klebsiella quasipneumoniae]MCI2967355.1 AAA family ATPase [Klebsiella quasipneumoniae]MCU6525196.1 AAA family ATPase [Klebsiella quasipneumoniae]HCI4233888.1 AAA family ATPase [Klebsiella quasipneumoniae subsp. similipneumoniae]HDH1322468.1 AAA family ATPase [Klebsiella quasipneumoniae subsp. similipneumoniae]